MTTINIQKNFLNIKVDDKYYHLFMPDEYKDSQPPVADIYTFLKGQAISDEQIMATLIRRYIPLRIVNGCHLAERSVVIGLIGARGSGKSCTGSMITIFDYLIRGIKVWSNMDIGVTFRYKDCVAQFKTESIDKLDLMSMGKGFKVGTIYLDEINVEFAEARRSMSRRNIIFTNMLQQLRHRRLDLLFTSQVDSWLDDRLRYQTDMFLRCKDASLTASGQSHGSRTGEFSFVDAFDSSGVWRGRPYMQGDYPIWSGLFWIKPFWQTYDTYLMQGLEEFPDITIEVKRNQQLEALKVARDKAEIVLDLIQQKGEMLDKAVWSSVNAETRAERMKIGAQLKGLGVAKKPSEKGHIYYLPPPDKRL